MLYDIIDMTSTDFGRLNKQQVKLILTAQDKKNQLFLEMQKQLEIFKEQVYSNGLKNSNLIRSKKEKLYEDFNLRCALIADELIVAVSLEYAESIPQRPETGYLIDYTLSYPTRYRIVKDYYLSKPIVERLILFKADEVVEGYLGGYYANLLDVLRLEQVGNPD